MRFNDDRLKDNWVARLLIELLGLAAVSAETLLLTAPVRIDLKLSHRDWSLILTASFCELTI